MTCPSTCAWPRLAAIGLLLAGTASGSVRAAEATVRWRTEYQQARLEAEQRKLPLVVVVGSEECVFCRKQDATTFKDPAVVAVLNEQFVPLRVDGNKEPTFARALRVQVLPTTVLTGPDGTVLGFHPGYASADQFREHVKRAMGAKAAPVEVARSLQNPVPSAPVGDGRSAQALLAEAREAHRTGRFAECLDCCELLASRFAGTAEGKEAGALADGIKSDPDRLAAACEQRNERTAALYVTLADAWVKKGQPREAEACLEKAVRLSPAGKTAESAQVRLVGLQRGITPAFPAAFERGK